MNSIKINNIKYDYKLFDTNELIEMIRKKLKFIESLEKTIQSKMLRILDSRIFII
jgi:rRNA-processing protein FCF1